MSLYNPEVKVELDALASMKSAADCLSIVRDERDRMEKELAKSKADNMSLQQTCKKLNDTVAEQGERLKAWEQAENAAKPIDDAHNYLNLHNTPFEDNDVDEACAVIRGLLATKETEAKPREVSPLFKQRLENTAQVLDQLTPVPMPDDGEMPTVNADRYNALRKTLYELHHVVLREVIAS